MAINIRVIGNEETTEYRDAQFLKSIIANGISKRLNGDILIITNATLFGYQVKDFDIIALGNFERNKNPIINDTFINDFCFIFETKNHPAEDIAYENNILKVKYNGKYHDITTQSEKQKYSLTNYFIDKLKESPYVCNFVWLRQLANEELNILTDNYSDNNFLPNRFSLSYLFDKAFLQNKPYGTNLNRMAFSCAKKIKRFDLENFKEYFDLFQKTKIGISLLTRKKLELITRKILNDQQYVQYISKKTLIVSGRAGTGKTIKIMRIACDLAINNNSRCLILTYNHALVGDMKRLFALAEIPDKIDSYTVNIMTLHKFFFELIIGFGLVKNENDPDAEVKVIPNYITKYDEYLAELYSYISQGLIQETDIQKLMKNRHDQVAWDFVLIDEGQDWNEIEKYVLYKIFTPMKLIVADGIDQLVRKKTKCNWERGENQRIETHKIHEKICLRQKKNLVMFVNYYARKFGINWNHEIKEELTGGRIIISTKKYYKELHEKEYKRCLENGNSAFEMMFFTSPSNVKKVGNDKYGNVIKEFTLTEDFKKMGIELWDGTKTDLRAEYSVNPNQHRVLQYDSCRGLEGWTVVCLELDEFIRYKFETYEKEKDDSTLGLLTDEQIKNNFVYLWSIIPLTRAIDTLIITIKDKDSKFAKTIKELANENSDFVNWIE
ncbi:MAG: AAA family ATPase [Ignavibacteria bacterium]|nr:AAA family ATPase [Ignavibacteria bacterium]